MKKIVTGILAAMMLLTVFAGCSSFEAPAKPEEIPPLPAEETPKPAETTPKAEGAPVTIQAGKFIVGLDDSFPPMGFRDKDNNIVGFDIDIATAVGKKLGLEVVLQPINWATKELEVNGGNVDVVWNGLTVTPERQESMLLSKPYLANSQVICVSANSEITNKAGLEGKLIGLQTGSSAETAWSKDEISQKAGKLMKYDDNVMALMDLKIGGLDAVIVDEVVANYYASQEPESYKVLADSLAKEEYAIGFKKDNQALHDQVMAAFDELIADGTMAEISTKWFGKDIVLK